MTVLAVSPLPSKWYQEKSGASASITTNADNTVSVVSGGSDSAYIYMPIQVSPADKVTLQVMSAVKSGALTLSIVEDQFGGSVYNQLNVETKTLQQQEITYTATFDSNVGSWIYLKIGSNSVVATDADIVWINVKVDNSSIGTLRDVLCASLDIHQGSITVSDKWTNIGVSSASITEGAVKIVLDDLMLTAGAKTERNALPHFSTELVFTDAKFTSKITAYDQYSRTLTIKFYSTDTNSFIDAATALNFRLNVRGSII